MIAPQQQKSQIIVTPASCAGAQTFFLTPRRKKISKQVWAPAEDAGVTKGKIALFLLLPVFHGEKVAAQLTDEGHYRI